MKNFLEYNTQNAGHMILTLALILACIAIGWYLYIRLRSALRNTKGSTRGVKIFRKAIIPLTFFILVIAIRLNLTLLTSDEVILKVLKDISRIAIIFGLTWISINTVHIVRFFIFRKLDIDQKDNLRARKIMTQFRILERIVVFILIFIAFAVVLMSFEPIRKLGISLFASAGIAGIILGLAAQTVIGSILAGFQIAITQPIRIEDAVVVEGEWGWIEEITLTYVVVRIWDKRRLILPTTYFIQNPFQNWTRNSADILGSVFVYTDYTMDVDQLRKAFLDIIKTTELWDGEVAVMQVTGSDNNRMEIRALMSASNSSKAWDLRVFVREKLIRYIHENMPENLPKTRIATEEGETYP